MGDEAPDHVTAGSGAGDRMQRVLELLDTREVVSVTELAHAFAVSEVTVRNDLATLARQGLIARIRGGARALQRGQSEVAFDVRLRVQEAEKRAIARAAAAMVDDGEAVALDSSTTAFYIALEFREKRELVVVTNGLRVAAALADARRELSKSCRQDLQLSQPSPRGFAPQLERPRASSQGSQRSRWALIGALVRAAWSPASARQSRRAERSTRAACA